MNAEMSTATEENESKKKSEFEQAQIFQFDDTFIFAEDDDENNTDIPLSTKNNVQIRSDFLNNDGSLLKSYVNSEAVVESRVVEFPGQFISINDKKTLFCIFCCRPISAHKSDVIRHLSASRHKHAYEIADGQPCMTQVNQSLNFLRNIITTNTPSTGTSTSITMANTNPVPIIQPVEINVPTQNILPPQKPKFLKIKLNNNHFQSFLSLGISTQSINKFMAAMPLEPCKKKYLDATVVSDLLNDYLRRTFQECSNERVRLQYGFHVISHTCALFFIGFRWVDTIFQVQDRVIDVQVYNGGRNHTVRESQLAEAILHTVLSCTNIEIICIQSHNDVLPQEIRQIFPHAIFSTNISSHLKIFVNEIFPINAKLFLEFFNDLLSYDDVLNRRWKSQTGHYWYSKSSCNGMKKIQLENILKNFKLAFMFLVHKDKSRRRRGVLRFVTSSKDLANVYLELVAFAVVEFHVGEILECCKQSQGYVQGLREGEGEGGQDGISSGGDAMFSLYDSIIALRGTLQQVQLRTVGSSCTSIKHHSTCDWLLDSCHAEYNDIYNDTQDFFSLATSSTKQQLEDIITPHTDAHIIPVAMDGVMNNIDEKSFSDKIIEIFSPISTAFEELMDSCRTDIEFLDFTRYLNPAFVTGATCNDMTKLADLAVNITGLGLSRQDIEVGIARELSDYIDLAVQYHRTHGTSSRVLEFWQQHRGKLPFFAGCVKYVFTCNGPFSSSEYVFELFEKTFHNSIDSHSESDIKASLIFQYLQK